MSKLFNIILVSLAVLCLSHELQAADVPLASMQQSSQQPEQGVHLSNVQIIKDIKTFIQQNPHLRLIRLNKKAPEDHPQLVEYTLGNRVSGDRLVEQYGNSFFYREQTNVSTQITYPKSGTGSVVTFVDINCLQDNTDGNAYIVAGGIGQRVISIVIEAPQTERFSYNVHVFGKN